MTLVVGSSAKAKHCVCKSQRLWLLLRNVKQNGMFSACVDYFLFLLFKQIKKHSHSLCVTGNKNHKFSKQRKPKKNERIIKQPLFISTNILKRVCENIRKASHWTLIVQGNWLPFSIFYKCEPISKIPFAAQVINNARERSKSYEDLHY